jgi:hypothetical protein
LRERPKLQDINDDEIGEEIGRHRAGQ